MVPVERRVGVGDGEKASRRICEWSTSAIFKQWLARRVIIAPIPSLITGESSGVIFVVHTFGRRVLAFADRPRIGCDDQASERSQIVQPSHPLDELSRQRRLYVERFVPDRLM
jgi:hypothetical protein